ncbi:hypothetical protein [Catenuloplanes atrovinosus]|uniref:Uncharacterized protein n=1 Tax=Catenuloplanes atrovinosus TaxID=137266 RepID=A0AAE3YJ35_9ACTN|nr:hypothetical protein [Catenuloplanes atrovinosus]MDR7273392.1 hypothetical protein [Catenuloplanes atrovinosus]
MDAPREVAVDAPRAWDRPLVVLPVFAVVSLVGGQLPSFSTAANLYSLSVGGTLMWFGLSQRVPRRPVPGRPGRGTVWWLAPAVVFVAFEGSTFLTGSTESYPTLSRLADPLLADPVVRAAGYFGWLCAFWALARR